MRRASKAASAGCALALALLAGVSVRSALAVNPGQGGEAPFDDPPREALPLSPDAERFERFLHQARPVCLHQASTRCFQLGWQFADENLDNRLSLSEAQTTYDAVEGYVLARRSEMPQHELAAAVMGLFVVNGIGLNVLHDQLDRDRDAMLSQEELLAHVELDERPIAEVLLDPSAIDREAVTRKLGRLAPLVERYLPENAPQTGQP